MSPYHPEKPVRAHVERIVNTLLEDDPGPDAQHIIECVMSIAPDTKTGSTHNRSIAAAAVWLASRAGCVLYDPIWDGVDFPRWTQLEISKAAGVAEMTIRNAVRQQFRGND
ncbi:hypothetical protein CW696_07005 [ANME-2 cluster archaeon]|nr:MAG: hypothetical protein CW696_07005 [ANME-2 cluster archaeon]